MSKILIKDLLTSTTAAHDAASRAKHWEHTSLWQFHQHDDSEDICQKSGSKHHD